MDLVTWCRLSRIRDLILGILVGFVDFVGFVYFVDIGWLWAFPYCGFVDHYCMVVVNWICYYGMSKYVVVCNCDYC